MSKRIEELEKKEKELDFFVDLYTYKEPNKKLEKEAREQLSEIRQRIEERKLAEKEFGKLIELRLIHVEKEKKRLYKKYPATKLTPRIDTMIFVLEELRKEVLGK